MSDKKFTDKKFTIVVFVVMAVFLVLGVTGNFGAYATLYIVLAILVVLWFFYDLMKS